METTLRYLSLNAQATWHRQLEDQLRHLQKIQARKLRQLERDKSQLQLSAISGRWSHAQAGRKA